MKIFLVEPFLGGSHKSWAQGYAAHSNYDVHIIGHSDSSWRWRMRGAAVTLAQQAKELASDVGLPDIVIASDFLNLAEFKGFVDQTLGHPQYMLYMHENQLCYPLSSTMKRTDEFASINWKSMCIADQIFINSTFHKQQLFNELASFLQSAPDNKHTHLIDAAQQKTHVLPVGVDLSAFTAATFITKQSTPAVPTILWNQRWEYDKNPDYVFASLAAIAKQDLPFSLILLGEDPRGKATELLARYQELQERVLHQGYANAHRYQELLMQSDIVVSAPRHEYFGISVVEAVAAGSIPVLPNDVSYPEILDAHYHTHALYEPGKLEERLVEVLANVDGYKQKMQDISKTMHRFAWPTMAQRYDKAFTIA